MSRVPPKEPEPRTGIAVIRAWVEPAEDEQAEKALRARVITVEHGDPESEQASTAAGIRNVIDLVREFLTGLASGDGSESR
jgi:predicted Zn-dependent protease